MYKRQLRAQSICSSSASGCSDAFNVINSTTCNAAVGSLQDVSSAINSGNGEVKVQTGSGNALDQAYTCVIINSNTQDYLGEMAQDDSKLIPLVGASDFNKIKIEWFSAKDLSLSAKTANIPSGVVSLPTSWTENTPPIMRAQVIQFGTSFKLSDFEGDAGNIGYNNTLFLYPSSGSLSNFSIGATRKSATFSPSQVKCESDLSVYLYSCSATITLNNGVSAGAKNAYLNLSAIYGKANYRISLWNNSDTRVVDFQNVQPSIDSTGRANDYFKRVSTRVEMSDTNFPYPVAEIATNGNFCKDFIVTDNPVDYSNNCTP